MASVVSDWVPVGVRFAAIDAAAPVSSADLGSTDIV
jgi:hypothetical protein